MMSFAIEVDKEVYENYFRIADSNGDGKIHGSEAVAFFCGSNLPRQVLAQIWSCADQDEKGFLDRLGFYNALKLMSVAQLSGQLTPENIKHALSSTSKIPAPKINITGIGNYDDSTEEDPLEWPKFSESDISKYAEIFTVMDRDKDGKITGEQARSLFLSWEIPKAVLRDIWYLSDCDRDGNLSLVEFCIAVYFMERHREGFSLPTSLPDTIRYDETLLKATRKGTDMPIPAPSITTEDGPGLYEFGANHMPPLNTTLAPSAPPLDSLSIDNSSTVERQLSRIEEGGSSNVNLGTCSICIEEPVEGACIPCGHMAGCLGCLQKIKESGGECPICRAKIVWIVKLYAV